MTPERYRQIDRLLEQALELEPGQRENFLERECGGDEELRHKLSAMLSTQQSGGGFLDSPALEVAAREIAKQSSSLVGCRLGHYEIMAMLGMGGMGEVYKARDGRLNRDVAIKVLPTHLTQDAAALARFEREARAVAALSHPNILAIHDFGDEQGRVYAVMELLDGQTLRQRLDHSTLSWQEAAEIGVAIADGLGAAHAKGIIHRDLKPENIFLTRDGGVKILDFGLARIKPLSQSASGIFNQTAEGLTEPGLVMGTIGYMSPEQVRGEEVDAPSDIFSLGCVLYEMAAGRRAFQRQSPVETMAAILHDNLEKFSEANVDAPAEFELLIIHCLEKNAGDRFHSAQDLGFTLRALLGGAKSTTTLPRQKNQATASAAWKMRGVVALTVILGLAVIIYLYFRPNTDAQPIRFDVPLPGTWIATEMENNFLAASPDGQNMVFVVESEGRRIIWVRPRDSVSARQLAGTEGASSPFWSPDSRWIGFFAEGKLKKIEVGGGPSQSLCEVRISVGTATWGRSGVILFGGQGAESEGIYRVSDAGGQAFQVIKPDRSRGEAWYFWPHFLPDSQHFLFLKSGSQYKGEAVVVGSLDGSQTYPLLHVSSRVLYTPPGYLLYVREGTLLAQPFNADLLRFTGEAIPIADRIQYFFPTGYADISASESLLIYRAGISESRLVWFDRNGRELGTVGTQGKLEEPRLSPDGKKVAAALADPATGTLDIWTMDLTRDQATRVTANKPFTSYGPIWSPDGRYLAFTTDVQGPPHLHRKLSSGTGEAESLIMPSEVQWADDWSADGKFIVYSQVGTGTKLDLWLLPLNGERRPTPFLNSKFNEKEARFSPDGRLIAYVSDESGKNEVYVQPIDKAGAKWMISTAGGSQPVWRRDGSELFYLASDNKLMAVLVKAGAKFEAGVPSPLFRTDPAAEHAYDATADGQKFLVNTSVSRAEASPITAVVNWTAGLKR